MCRSVHPRYILGQGVPKAKPQSAIKHWKRAAKSGDALAQTNLGICYMNGEGGLPQDPPLAVAYYRKAAEQGYAQAQVGD